MKSLHLGAAMVALIAGNAWASDADARAWYAKASVGQTVDADVGGIALSDDMAYGAALGTAIGPVRVEAGVSRLSGNFAGIVEADALDYHATGFLDLAIGENASAFVGAGVDYVDGEASIYGSTLEASGQGHHWAVGGAYRFSPGVIGEVQYRRINADMEADYLGDFDLEAGELTVGLRLAL